MEAYGLSRMPPLKLYMNLPKAKSLTQLHRKINSLAMSTTSAPYYRGVILFIFFSVIQYSWAAIDGTYKPFINAKPEELNVQAANLINVNRYNEPRLHHYS